MDFNSAAALRLHYYLSAWEMAVRSDRRLRSAHVSLMSALFLIWLGNPTTEEITVSRKELMLLSKVGSIATYHKCIGELVAFGYIHYRPTYNAYIGTKVQFNVCKSPP